MNARQNQMMKNCATSRVIAYSSVVGAMAFCLGCSGSPGDGRQQTTARTQSPVEVASISGAGVVLTFYSVPGPSGRPIIGMSERGSAYAKTSPIPALVAQNLTSQEIYLAIAPEGATAPAPLVAAQADQAAMLDRSADVRHVTIDRNAVVEKDLTACVNTVFALPWDQSGSWWHLYAAGTYTNFTTINAGTGTGITSPVAFGECNESVNNYDLLVYWNFSQQWPGGSFVEYETDIPVGYYVRWYYQNAQVYNGTTYGADYSLQGDGCNPNCQGQYDMVFGFWNHSR